MKKIAIPKFAPIGFAKTMRSNPTPEENKLWFILRDRKFSNFKFRRQHILGKFIVDFICVEKKLIIEADGSHHDVDQDSPRDNYLRSWGYRVMRFTNFEIKRNLGVVSDNIWQALHDETFDPFGTPSPGAARHPLPTGRGDLGVIS